ncbi:TonB-dependent receptor plug domain-containing protein [Aquimarina sp. RZ0]|uniref:TonB-dependent receptor plug domain-containing protein n=1 Tax=Aquimarina sp. RZ0 TaxID=2607730 RepID=UPI00165F5812|nr:TonB-dependent receptor plug domain-containing protein [Aquimarina sp. RZ0]
MRINVIIIILLVITVCDSKIFSQEPSPSLNYQGISLDKVLHSLEKIYEVKFSFNSEITKDKNVKIIGKLLLEEVLKKIQSQTSLFFEKIDDRYYVIRDASQNQNLLCIQLLDGETIIPLEGASIKKKRSGTIITSDDQGYSNLYLKQEEQDTISIHFLGYQDIEYAVSDLRNEKCKKIYLYQNNQELEEVLIQEYVTRGFSKEKLSGSVVLDPSQLGLLPRLIEPDILKSVQFLPGIESTTEKASELFIRGSNSDQNLILWDGIKIYNSGHFFNLLSAFNPYVTESVKVSRGFAALQYDSRTGGVIDIKSKNKVPKDVGFGFGSNLTHLDAYLEFPLGDKIGVIVSGRKSITDLIDTPTTDMYNTRIFRNRFSGFSFENTFSPDEMVTVDTTIDYQDFTAKIIANLTDSSKLTASGFLFEDKTNSDIIRSASTNPSATFEVITIDDFFTLNRGAGINWEKKWGDTFSITTNGYYTDTQLEHININRAVNLNNQDNVLNLEDIYEDRLKDFGGSANFRWTPSKKHTIITGYDFSSIKITDMQTRQNLIDGEITFEEGAEEKNETQSVYIEDTFNIGNKVSINLGLKGNHFSVRDRFFLEPKLGMEFSLAKGINAKITGERKHQVVDLIPTGILGFFSVDIQSWILRTPSYGPVLRGDQIGTGLIINKKDWFIELESYYKEIDGADTFNAIGENDNSSFGTSRTFGGDLLIKKNFDRYSTWITYSYIDQELRFEEQEEQSFSGSFDITHNFAWIHSYLLGNFEFSLGWNIKTGLPYTPVLSNEINIDTGFFEIEYGTLNSKRLPTYHRLDFSTSYRFTLSKNSKWRGKIALSFINLYDRKNVLARRATEQRSSDGEISSDVLSLGFTPNLSFRMDF